MRPEQDGDDDVEGRSVPWVDRLGDALYDAAKRQIDAEEHERASGRARMRCSVKRNRAK
jgi:hypothetical protein